jgi:hypothetical protein
MLWNLIPAQKARFLMPLSTKGSSYQFDAEKNPYLLEKVLDKDTRVM